MNRAPSRGQRKNIKFLSGSEVKYMLFHRRQDAPETLHGAVVNAFADAGHALVISACWSL